MQRKLLMQFDAEVETIARIRGVPVSEVVRRTLEFLDMEFHGVVPLPLEQPKANAKGKD